MELDTFGGRVDSALEIVDTILSAPQGKTIAFVKTKAISAGALIALACSTLVMRENTSIGDCAPITYSKEGTKMLGGEIPVPAPCQIPSPREAKRLPRDAGRVHGDCRDGCVCRKKWMAKTIYMDSQAFDDLSPAEKAKVFVEKGRLSARANY